MAPVQRRALFVPMLVLPGPTLPAAAQQAPTAPPAVVAGIAKLAHEHVVAPLQMHHTCSIARLLGCR